jgi:hypothetical protein
LIDATDLLLQYMGSRGWAQSDIQRVAGIRADAIKALR